MIQHILIIQTSNIMRINKTYSFLLLFTLCYSSTIIQDSPRRLQSLELSSHSQYRFIVSDHNKKAINAFNSAVTDFKLAPNQFIHLTTEEFAATMTTKLNTPPFDSQSSSITSIPLIGSTPTSQSLIIDWKLKGVISPVKSQGYICNGCYAFTATSDIQSSYLIKYGKSLDLSEQNIIDCSYTQGNNGCSGGFYYYSFLYVMKYGIHTQSNYPYTGQNQQCKNIAGTTYKINSINSFNGNNCNTLTNFLKTRPVIVSVDGGNIYWQFYSSGILTNCGPNNYLNHGVQVTGIYQYTNGTNYYVVKNSWGMSWGQKGYIRIDRNGNSGNLCLICSFPYYSII